MAAGLDIRAARPADGASIAELAGELGYPTEPTELLRRMAALPADDDVWVVESDGLVVGWLHVAVHNSLTAGRHAEILGLIVRDGWRGRGAGRLLMDAAERSAMAHGLSMIRLRSRSERSGAHAFYAALGYQELKQQVVFSRQIEPSSG
jgi:ribosomal protein S18 acetylase RimI-like enzyme